jgi:FKBP-type peptidyl-prolyl cis-trans isomerase 2
MAEGKKIGKGDLVYVDYDAFFADNNRLFDTTRAESAKEAGFFTEEADYSPMPVLLGSGQMFEAFENAVENAEIGKDMEIRIASADAAGARDPKLIETYQIKEFHKQDINPQPGIEVRLGNRRGTVMYVGAGRVKVDFNSPLAGKDLIYKFIVKEVVTDETEKAKATVKRILGTSDGFEFKITSDKVSVTLPDLTKFDQNWPVARFRIVADLRKVADVGTVEFIEVWAAEKKSDAEAPKKAEGKTETESDDGPAKPKKKSE